MKYIVFVCLVVISCMVSHAQEQDTIYVSCSQTVHVRFGSDLLYVNLGDDVLVARTADRNKDFLAVKAVREFDFTTSIFCIESDGDVHSFPVRYSERPVNLMVDARGLLKRSSSGGHDVMQYMSGACGSEDIPEGLLPIGHACDDTAIGNGTMQNDCGTCPEVPADLKKQIYHIGHKEYGIMLTCDNIFYKDDVLYLVLWVVNGSAVSYVFSEPRFALESRKKVKRGLEYEKVIVPRRIYGENKVTPGCSARVVASFDKISLLKSQVLKIYFYENGGARNFILTLDMKDVNGAGTL